MKYRMIVEFNTSIQLGEHDLATLTDTVRVQVEEPQTRDVLADGTWGDSFDADWSSDSVNVRLALLAPATPHEAVDVLRAAGFDAEWSATGGGLASILIKWGEVDGDSDFITIDSAEYAWVESDYDEPCAEFTVQRYVLGTGVWVDWSGQPMGYEAASGEELVHAVSRAWNLDIDWESVRRDND